MLIEGQVSGNLMLLSWKIFVKKKKKKEKYKYLEDKHLKWDSIKCKLRGITINDSKLES